MSSSVRCPRWPIRPAASGSGTGPHAIASSPRAIGGDAPAIRSDRRGNHPDAPAILPDRPAIRLTAYYDTPEVREYMAIGVVKDEEIGQPSEIKEVVYAG